MALNDGDKHLLKLIANAPQIEGWSKVSKTVWPVIAKLPNELVEKRPSNDGGHVRLTDTGHTILMYL